MRWFGSFAMLLMTASLCPAQTARESLEEVNKLRRAGRIHQAGPLLERALAGARQTGDRWAEAEALRGMSQVLSRQGKHKEARAELDRAYAIFEALGDRLGLGRAYQDYAYLEWVAGNRGKEIEFCRKALMEFEAAGGPADQAQAIAQLIQASSDVGERLQLVEKGLPLARVAGDRLTEARILHRWGDTLFSQGRYADASEKLAAALTQFMELRLERDAASTLISLGRVHRAHGKLEQSLEAYQRALALTEKSGDLTLLVGALNAISVAYFRLGDSERELEYAQRALETARKTGAPRLIRRQMLELGTMYRLRGDFRSAVAVIEEAIAAGGETDDIPWRHLASAYHHLNDPRALATADKAVETNRRRLPEFLPEALRSRAIIRKDRGLLEQALGDIEEGLAIIEQQRRGALASDEMKQGFAEQNQLLYALAVEVLTAMGRHGQAVEIAERARGRAFVDLMASRDTPLKPRHAEQLAALRVLDLEIQGAAAQESALRSGSLHVPARGPGNATGNLAAKWLEADPELRSFVTAEPYSLAELAAAAARLNSTILSYWVNKSATYVWAVKPDGRVDGVRVNVSREELEKTIAETRVISGGPRRLGEPEAEVVMRGGESIRVSASTRKAAWKQLYQWLIQPVRDHLSAEPGSLLTVVPHGPLFHVSFAALLDEQGRYLVEQHRIHYTPAGTVLDFTKRKKPQTEARELLLVADPAGMRTPDGKPLPALPGARREAQAIARLASKSPVTLLEGAEAREDRVRGALAGKAVVHFATHGVLRPGRPSETFLALAPPAAAGHDAWLTAGEVYQLDMNADLVMLSACRSAAGTVSPDGLVGLTRAFFYAGTPSVVASLWDAADEPSSRLAEDFYRHYFQGRGKSAALREAQLRMIAALRKGRVQVSTVAGPVTLPEHPMFWAGLVLNGEP